MLSVSGRRLAAKFASRSNSTWTSRVSEVAHGTIPTSLTYDDVLLIPTLSPIKSRKDVNISTRLTPRIKLPNPIISSNMDTVTEKAMAIAMARNGSIGILHRFLSAEDQVRMVRAVKRAESFLIDEPYTVAPTSTITELQYLMHRNAVGSILVTEDGTSNGKLVGIVTTRDLRFVSAQKRTGMKVSEVMTPRERLIVAPFDSVTRETAQQLLDEHRCEKLPLIDANNHLKGLITSKDIESSYRTGHFKSVDSRGRLLVGAAIGVKDGDLERAQALVAAGCDVIVIDVAHGHSDLAIDATRRLREVLPDVDIISGNVATAQGVRDLVKAGANAIKVGIGGGSICTTRIVTGCGVPQLSAVADCALEARRLGDCTIIADGGIKASGDIVKALAVGADTVMLGNMLAGTDESPGEAIYKNGRKIKIIRGMAGIGSVVSKRERENLKNQDIFDVVPEGVEGVVPYRGPVENIIRNLCGGIASGVSYCGGRDLEEMRANVRFIRISSAGKTESGAHDITLV